MIGKKIKETKNTNESEEGASYCEHYTWGLVRDGEKCKQN